jgi:HD-GYP domain-containing protein (c-di-GMP phosphodiesterase class II)
MSALPLPRSSDAGVPPPGLLDLLARLEERELTEHGHAVATLAGRVCRGLALSDTETARVELAALLHDVGKVELAPGLLDRPGPLSRAEWRLMREHPVRGAALVGAVPGLERIVPLLRGHHERWDGRGYPDRLAGERIPLGARVIHACDALDAMTSARSYRDAAPLDAALREIAACAGAQFDPVVADVLIAVKRDG